MLTKNFYSYMRAALQSTSATFTLTDGTTKSISLSNGRAPFVVMKNWVSSSNPAGVSFGTGTTPADASNYKLESILSSAQISVATPSTVSFSRFDAYDEYSVTFGITNRTTDAITISEIGLIAHPNGGNWDVALVDRTVLDTPVTIPAGQSKQITYTIRFNY